MQNTDRSPFEDPLAVVTQPQHWSNDDVAATVTADVDAAPADAAAVNGILVRLMMFVEAAAAAAPASTRL